MLEWFALAAMAGTVAWLAAAAAANAQTCAAPGTASTVCSGTDCAKIMVPMLQGAKGSAVDIPISFAQGADDSQTGQGFDEVAAIAFTLGVPGTGTATPLTFECTNGNLAAGTVTVAAAIANDFTVAIENAQCTNRSRCLCPDTTAGQTRDNFVNIVVYGPKNLPEQGPVQIPVLPPSGTIVTLTMRIASGAPSGEIPLHVFSALDSGAPAKPQFAANLSIGDQAACDVTANTQNRSNVTFADGKVTAGPPGMPCVGDCDGSHTVAINELITGVSIALGSQPPSICVPFQDDNGQVTIAQLIRGVNHALNNDCPTS